jgi:hypothetical protein
MKKRIPNQQLQATSMTSPQSSSLTVRSNLQQMNDFRSQQMAMTPPTIMTQGGEPGQMAGSDTTMMPKKKGASLNPALLVAGGYALANQYISQVGDMTGNKAAANAGRNTLQAATLATGTGIALKGAVKTGMGIGGAAGAAVGSVLAVAAIAAVAYGLALENQKMLRNIENRQADSAKSSQRLGYISTSRGR